MLNRNIPQTPGRFSSLYGIAALAVLSALTPCWGADFRSAGLGRMLGVEVETHYVVDGRSDLEGVIKIADVKNFTTEIQKTPALTLFRLRVKSLSHAGRVWETTIPIGAKVYPEYPFSIPISQLATGYNRLEVAPGSPGEGAADFPATGKFLPLGKGGPIVDFAIVEKKKTAPRAQSHGGSENYLAFVIDTAEQLIRHQSCRLGGKPDGALFITVVGKDAPPRRSLVRDTDGKALRSKAVDGGGRVSRTDCDSG